MHKEVNERHKTQHDILVGAIVLATTAALLDFTFYGTLPTINSASRVVVSQLTDESRQKMLVMMMVPKVDQKFLNPEVVVIKNVSRHIV